MNYQHNVEYTIAVICEKQRDFQEWKHDVGITDSVSDKKYSFIVGEMKYMAVSTEDATRGYRIDGVVLSDTAKRNKNYVKIMNSLIPSML